MVVVAGAAVACVVMAGVVVAGVFAAAVIVASVLVVAQGVHLETRGGGNFVPKGSQEAYTKLVPRSAG